MKKSSAVIPCLVAVLIVSLGAIAAFGQESAARDKEKGQKIKLTSKAQVPGALDPSIANEVKAAIDRGLNWLAANQNADGSWSETNFPALTALALQAFVKGDHPDKKQIVDKAAKFILSCVQDDGGIYRRIQGRKGGGLSNYNTAICMMALHAVGDPSFTKVIQNARKFVAGTQYMGDDVYKGGFGYDKDNNRAYTDLMNTFYAVEAMSVTANVEDKRGKTEKKADINWDETVKFIEKMQNKPGAGDDAGGIYYNPSDPKAGTSTNKQGVVVMRAYGSITYSGLLALIHAKVSRDDVRVKSAFDWACKHWSLEENPGMGQQGVFFFYNILSKCLAAYGQDLVTLPDGKNVNWKTEVARKLISLQQVDSKTGHGYWENKNNSYWENNSILVTAYSLVALESL